MRPAILDHLAEILEEFEPQGLHGGLAVLALALEIGIVRTEEFVRHPQNPRLVFALHSENRRKQAKRVTDRHLADEIAFALPGGPGQIIDEFLGARLHRGVDPLQSIRCKPGTRNLPVDPVLGRIHLDDGAHGANTLIATDAPVEGGMHDPGRALERQG